MDFYGKVYKNINNAKKITKNERSVLNRKFAGLGLLGLVPVEFSLYSVYVRPVLKL